MLEFSFISKKHVMTTHSSKVTLFFSQTSAVVVVLFSFVLPLGIVAQNIAFPLLMFCCLLSGQWREKAEVFKKNWVSIGFFLILFWAYCGLIYTPHITHYAAKLIRDYAAIIGIFLIMHCVKDNVQLRIKCYLAFVLGCFFIALLGFIWGLGLLPHWKMFTSPGPYVLTFSIFASLFVAFGAFVCLHLTRFYQSKKAKLFLFIIFVALSYSLLFQNTERTGDLIYFVLAFVFIIQILHKVNRCKLFFILILCLAAIIGIIFISATLQHRIIEMYNNFYVFFHSHGQVHNTNMGIRLWESLAGIRLFASSPIIGHGLGSYQILYHSVMPGSTGHPVDTENTFTFMIAEHGAIGLLLLLALFLFQLRYALLADNTIEKHLGIMLVIAFIILSISQAGLTDQMPRYFYLLFSGLLFANHFSLKQVFSKS